MSGHHLFVCTGTTCSQEGAEETLHHLQEELRRRSLQKSVRVTLCRCLGQCGRGPNMVVYPEGIWYGPLHAEEISQIVGAHLIDGQPVIPLIQEPPEQMAHTS